MASVAVQQQPVATRRSYASGASGPSNSNRSSTASHANNRISTTSSSSGRNEELKTVGQWRIGRTIGKGSSGRVKVAKHCVTGQYAAVKIVPKGSILSSRLSMNEAGARAEKLLRGIEREIVIMKLIDHPNVLSLYDVWETEKDLYLVIEYVAGGELFDYLVRRGRLPPSEALHYFQQIIFAVDYCHRFNICHRDLKPENLLLDRDKNIKVADFGMAAWQDDERMLETSCGSPHYASPEIVAGKAYNGAASDIWSCGIILFALLTGRLPFDDENIRALLQKVKYGYFEMPDDIDETARDLLRRMLEKDPELRITMPEIMSHPFFLARAPRLAGNRELPTPLPLDAMARPVKRHEIDADILSNLRTLWHGVSDEDIYQALLSREKTWEKAIYHLLIKYRDRHLENYNMDGDSEEEDSSEEDPMDGTMRGTPIARQFGRNPVPQSMRSPTKHRRVDVPPAQQVRRKPAPLRENEGVQVYNTPPPRPQAPTPKKAGMQSNVADSPIMNGRPETLSRQSSKLGPRSPMAPSGPRPPSAAAVSRTTAVGTVAGAPAITLQLPTPIKDMPQAMVEGPRSPPMSHTAPMSVPMSPRSLAEVSPPQLPPLSPQQVDPAQFHNFMNDLANLANQLNSMTIRSSTASSSSANSTFQNPEFQAYMSYMSTQVGTPLTSPRPEQRALSPQLEVHHESPEQAEDEGQFGDAPDDDTEDISLTSIAVESRFSPSPVPPSPISPIVGLGFGSAPRAPSRSGPPPVSGRWSQASGSYRTRSMSSRCESPILTPGLSAGFHSPSPVQESARNSSGSSYGSHGGHSTITATYCATPQVLQAERPAPPLPGRRASASTRAPITQSKPRPPIPEEHRIESFLGREASYVFIDTLDMPTDDRSTMSWGQKRGSGFSTHSRTEGFAMLKKRKKSEPVSSDPLPTQTQKRSWFNNLFSFKPTSHEIIVHSQTVREGRDMVHRCLTGQGVNVKVVDYDGMRGLKCKIADTRDIHGNVVKGIRFRIEFTRGVMPSEGYEIKFGTNACLTLEKGAQSSFNTAYNSLKKAVVAHERPKVEASPPQPRTSYSLPRPRAPGSRPSIFDTVLNVGPSYRTATSVPNTPQFGPQFGAYQFTGLQRPNTIRS